MLSNVVDKGLSINSHYRFYMFSHADTPRTASTAGDAAWANGTLSTVCSSFAQQASLQANVPMNPSISGPGNFPDGLVEYSVPKRTAAGYAEYAIVSNAAKDTCFLSPGGGGAGGAVIGGGIGLLGGPVGVTVGAVVGASAGDYCSVMADNIGNQVDNCFGNDGCDDVSDTWKNVTPGIAVSPEDISNWDLPNKGGTWGYNEAAFYAEVSYRHKYEWAKSSGTGSLIVTVVDTDGTTVPGATIMLNDEVVGDTGVDGTLTLDARPAGSYYVAAQRNECTSVISNLPPLPPAPSPVSIGTLPSCSSISAATSLSVGACSYTSYNSPFPCPDSWINVATSPFYTAPDNQCVITDQTTEAPVSSGGTDQFANNGYQQVPVYLCSCVRQPPACNTLHPLESGGAPTTVLASVVPDAVTIRLCNGGLVQQGPHFVPQSCPQSCNAGTPCDSGLQCGTDNLCHPVPRELHIFSTSLNLQTYHSGTLGLDPYRNEYSAPADLPIVDLHCKPGADIGYGACVDNVEVDFDFQCAQDPNGGLSVNASAKLLSGCGSDATDENDTLSWTIGVPPFSSGEPNPARDYGDPTSQAASCFGAPGTCDDNGVHFSFEFANVSQ